MRQYEKTLRAYVRNILQEQIEGPSAGEEQEAKEAETMSDEGKDIENKSQAKKELKAFIDDGLPQIPANQLDALMDQFKVLAQQAMDKTLAKKEEEIQKAVALKTGDKETAEDSEEAEGAEDQGGSEGDAITFGDPGAKEKK